MPIRPVSRPTAKQRACTHPTAHVHPTYDDRWETCDLCHIIRPRPLPAPWIVEWDESQPSEPVPTLFEEPAPTPAPSASATAKKRAATAAIVREQPETFGDLLRAARRDRALLGSPLPWRLRAPDLDDVHSPDQITTCHRCRGLGTISDTPHTVGEIRRWADPFDRTAPPHVLYAVAHEPSSLPPRTCPRCQRAGRIPKYAA